MAPFASGYGPKGGGGGDTLNGGNDVVVLDYGNRDHVFAGRMVAAAKAAATTNVVAIENVERHTRPTAVVSSAVKRKDALKEKKRRRTPSRTTRRIVRGDEMRAGRPLFRPLWMDKRRRRRRPDAEEERVRGRTDLARDGNENDCVRCCLRNFECLGIARKTPVCALAGIGRLNGISVDIGAETIDCATISDGKIVESSCRRIEGGGERCCELALNAIREGEEIYTQMEKWERMVVNRNVARVRCSADDEGKEDENGIVSVTRWK